MTCRRNWTAAWATLSARALYMFDGNKDTLFLILGTNEPDAVGRAVFAGCIGMLNADVRAVVL